MLASVVMLVLPAFNRKGVAFNRCVLLEGAPIAPGSSGVCQY